MRSWMGTRASGGGRRDPVEVAVEWGGLTPTAPPPSPPYPLDVSISGAAMGLGRKGSLDVAHVATTRKKTNGL